MAKRYYCPQFSDFAKGWVDLPSLASLKEKEAVDAAESFAFQNQRITRVIRKPHGWTP
jgi:hypothetical protein